MYIKDAFDITKENIILAQPLVIYLVVISLTSAGLAQIHNQIAFYIFFIANILLSTAFFAGWFYMARKTVEHSKKEFEKSEEKGIESIKLINTFFPGVGEYFLSVTAGIALYTAGYALLLFLMYKAGLHLLPHPHIDWIKMASAQTPEQMHAFVSSLSLVQLKALNFWFMYIGFGAVAYTFLTMFYFPAIIYETKNPLLAFWRNLQFVFRNLLGSAGIMLFLMILNMIVSVLSLLFNMNVILSIIGLIITFYFMTYCLVLIFLYYDEQR